MFRLSLLLSIMFISVASFSQSKQTENSKKETGSTYSIDLVKLGSIDHKLIQTKLNAMDEVTSCEIVNGKLEVTSNKEISRKLLYAALLKKGIKFNEDDIKESSYNTSRKNRRRTK